MAKIRVAVAGVGNCASAFIQGIEYYKTHDETAGLLYPEICGYKISDIEIVAAFDVDGRKVGKDLSEAIYASPNCTTVFQKVPHTGVTVQMGPVLDGVPNHLKPFVTVAQKSPVNVVNVLKESKADVLINVLPTGSKEAARVYADAAIKEVKISFVNGIPEMIACDPTYAEIATRNRVPVIGDDFKSQIGSTLLHRALIVSLVNRGIRINKMYQYNYAGNTDFANLENRGESKEVTKTAALQAELPYPVVWGFAPMFINGQDDIKTGVIVIKGANWGGNPIKVELRVEVDDSANAGGVMADMIRLAKVAADRGLGGPIFPICAYYAKHPPKQIHDIEAKQMVDEFIKGG